MPSKSVWLVTVLVAAGAVIFVLSFKQKQEQPRGVVIAAPDTAVKLASPVGGAAAPAIVTGPEGGLETGYAVQVYSFQDKTRAEKALGDLRSNGYQAFLVVSDLGEKGTWYRVRVGGIADEKEAQVMLENVRKNYKSGFIVKPKV